MIQARSSDIILVPAPAQQSTNVALGLNTGLEMAMPIAGAGARSLAFMYDLKVRILGSALWFGIGQFINDRVNGRDVDKLFSEPQVAEMVLIVIPSLILYFLYHPLFEYFWKGRTPGKAWAGLRIVDEFGRAPSLQAVMTRTIFRFFDMLPSFYVVGLACCFGSRYAQRFGDFAAGTYLVHDVESPKRIRKILKLREASPLKELRQWDFAFQLFERWSGLLPNERCRLAHQFFETLPKEWVADLPKTGSPASFETPLYLKLRALVGLEPYQKGKVK